MPKIDIPGIMVPIVDDTELYPPNQPSIKGRKAIRESYEPLQGMKFESYEHKIERVEFSESGDLGYIMLTASHSAFVEGVLHEDEIKGVIVWKKIDNEWKVMVDCWNLDSPKEES
jgi:ketosteroid isomerase-like protein